MMISGMIATKRLRAITMARCLPSILLNRRLASRGKAIHECFCSSFSWYCLAFSWYCLAREVHAENLLVRPSADSFTAPPWFPTNS